MSSRYAEEIERTESYARQRGLSLQKQLGFGQDGIVFLAGAESAIKTFVRNELYVRERDVYLHLQANDVIEAAGFTSTSRNLSTSMMNS